MQISKIKFEGGKTLIEYSEDFDSGIVTKDTVFKSDSKRHADFSNAAQELIPLAISILKLPLDYKDGIEFRGLSISENDHQGLGAVVTMMKTIEGVNSPFVMNTPHLHNAEDGNSLMPRPFRIQVETLIKEAELYLNGKREQGDLFVKEAA